MAARRRLCKHAPPRSDSESDEDKLIPLSVYLAAEIGSALQDKDLFCRAVLELSEMLALYSRASKPVQKQCVADTVSALWLCDWGGLQAKAVSCLVSSIEQHLPKAKREACLRECKQAKLAHHRKIKRAGTCPESLIDLLPDHLLMLIFGHLPPPDLARAACVSKQWQELIEEDNSLWLQYCQKESCLGRASSAFRGEIPVNVDTSAGCLECCLCGCILAYTREAEESTAASDEKLTRMWQSRRVVTEGKLAWAAGEDLCSCQGNDYYPITVKMVVASFLGQRNFLKAVTGSSDSDTDSEKDVHQGRMWRYSPLPTRQ